MVAVLQLMQCDGGSGNGQGHWGKALVWRRSGSWGAKTWGSQEAFLEEVTFELRPEVISKISQGMGRKGTGESRGWASSYRTLGKRRGVGSTWVVCRVRETDEAWKG